MHEVAGEKRAAGKAGGRSPFLFFLPVRSDGNESGDRQRAAHH